MKLIKFFAMLLTAASMAFFFTACSSDDDKDDDGGNAQVTTTFSDLVDTGSALTFSYTQTTDGMSIVTTETYGYSGSTITSHTTVTEYPSESIAAEMKNSAPSESLILDLIGKIASEEYKSNCSQDAITARLAQHRVDYMTVQSTFNETYFNDIVKTVLLSESGSVRIITKTDAEIGGKEDK